MARQLIYGQIFAGAEDDLKQATRRARYMVTHWGMSDKLGPVAFRIGEEHVFLGKEIQEPRDFSEGTAQMIDDEVQKILREAEENAFDFAGRANSSARLKTACVKRWRVVCWRVTPSLASAPVWSMARSTMLTPVKWPLRSPDRWRSRKACRKASPFCWSRR